jgi:hypothetical protein
MCTYHRISSSNLCHIDWLRQLLCSAVDLRYVAVDNFNNQYRIYSNSTKKCICMKVSLNYAIPALATSLLLVACGGGSGGTPSSPNSGASILVSGTASVGAPLALADVIFIDGNGTKLTAKTDSEGKYNIPDVSSLVAPILVSVTGLAGDNPVTYSSILSTQPTAATTVNITPITDSILFQATSKSPSTYLNNPSLLSTVSIVEVNKSAANTAIALSQVLDGMKSGSSAGYSPITTPFSANSKDPYDKIMDLISVYPASNVGSNSIDINLSDKSGSVGTVKVSKVSTSQSKLASLPPSVSQLDLSKINDFFNSYNNFSATQEGLSSQGYADLFGDNFLRNGLNKDQWISATRNVNSPNYQLNFRFSNPVIDFCSSDGACRVTFQVSRPSGNIASTAFFKYNQSLGSWQSIGNQALNLAANFNSYAMYWKSSDQIRIGVGWGIRSVNETKENNPYNSASVIFQDKNGNQDIELFFVNKPNIGGACNKSNNNYWGLLVSNLDDPTSKTIDSSCQNWLDVDDDDFLSDINNKILDGGYKMIVKAYTSFDWTGTETRIALDLKTPLVTSKSVSKEMFPNASVGVEGGRPFVKVDNAQDFTLTGSFCMSTVFSNGCDMSNQPANTYFFNGTNTPISFKTYAPNTWPSGAIIETYYINAKDKLGRNLRVTQ